MCVFTSPTSPVLTDKPSPKIYAYDTKFEGLAAGYEYISQSALQGWQINGVPAAIDYCTTAKNA